MIAELVVVLAALGGGCALLRTAGIRDWGLLPLGFLAGVCLMIGVGFVQVATGLPTAPEITLAVVLGAPVAWWIAAWRRGRDVRVWPPAAVASVLAVAAAVAVLREARMLKWHSDSLTYLMAGRLIAEGDYRSTASTELLTTRVLGVPLLHAPADLGGALYLRSVTPLLAAATLAAVVWFVRRAGLGTGRFAAVAALAGLLLLTNNRVVFSFFYLNGHLLVAACVLLVAGSGWLLANGDTRRPALMIMQIIAVPVIVITRPEGFLLAALVLLPTAVSAHLPRRHRAAVLASFGGACLLFAALQLWVFLDRDTSVPPVVVGGAVVGAGALAAIPLLPRLGRGPRLLALAEAGLWLGLVALAVREPDTLRTSLRATYRNLFEGFGGYGLSIVVLVGLLLLAWLLSPPLRHAAHLRFPLTTFLPLCLVLAYLREGAYRAADADSMNRMLMHVVPLAVLFLFALLTGAGRDVEAAPREPAADDLAPAAEPQPAAVP
ncbi:hypothetical protein [Phytohabitans houttuyneae]|uniref:Glycosyltransferase RgtA/B/C/D-like domain-containing protein n=1 Tax=Phytohabitans houttuyneae TaxID=1076126 RepID=A0A6V8KP29_9ACTN|nr:hypothetical protein [Phytohabitans houttuyneae]GFJ82435.1 hypothetical protein Phou_066150 [Phytohabitans houttuyneae]